MYNAAIPPTPESETQNQTTIALALSIIIRNNPEELKNILLTIHHKELGVHVVAIAT